MMTLTEFQATGRDVSDLSTVHDFLDAGTPGRVYHGLSYLEPMPDGQWLFVCGNQQTVGALPDMEARLYLWALQECGEDMGASHEVSATLCRIEGVTGTATLADIIATPRANSGSAALLDDCCDVEACADVACDDVEAGDAIGHIYEMVTANDYADDDGRSNGPQA